MLAAAAALSATRPRSGAAAPQQQPARPAWNAEEVFSDLLAGNRRFTSGQRVTPRSRPEDFRTLAHGQFPQAIVVSCSDSRVPPEILFDVGVGDLFVVRVAGNVIAGTGVALKGSIEYAVAELRVPLILVLGHTGCGAVKAAMQHIQDNDPLPGSINGLVDLIKPGVAKSKGLPGDPLDNAIRQNVESGVETLCGLDPILAPRIKDGRLKVAGGVYDLATGAVTPIRH
jgi:carbonic anhydrase